MISRFVLWLFFLALPPFSQACVSAFSTAEEVFISFVRANNRSLFDFDSGYEQKITKSLREGKWTASSAENFLKDMTDRIGETNTLERIKSASYFAQMSYQGFKERAHLYEEWLGREGVNRRLSQGLGAFARGRAEEMRRVFEYLKSYAGEEGAAFVHRILNQRPATATRWKLDELQYLVQNVNIHMKTKEESVRKEYVFRVLERNVVPLFYNR